MSLWRRPQRSGRLLAGALAATLVPATLGTLAAPAGAAGASPPAHASSSVATAIAGWRMVKSYPENTLHAGQGLATVDPPGAQPYVLYRGDSSVPQKLAAEGWTHIGDPDSAKGYIFDAYQGASSGDSKLFVVTTLSGHRLEYLHTLVRGELYNNSFVTVSPSTRWMVGGEWGTMSHLQVYPTPLLNPRTPHLGGSLKLAGYIRLDHAVNDIQGCDFLSSRQLVCASDDDSKTLFPNEKPLLLVTLGDRLHYGTVTAHVRDLGPLPQRSACIGTYEAEGVDYDPATGVLRAEVMAPAQCILTTTVYEYKRR